MLSPDGRALSVVSLAELSNVDALRVVHLLTGAIVGVSFGSPHESITWSPWTEEALHALAGIRSLDTLTCNIGDPRLEYPLSELTSVTAHRERVDSPGGRVLVDDLIITVDHESGHFDEVRATDIGYRGLVSLLRVQLGVPHEVLGRLDDIAPGASLALWPQHRTR